MSARQSGWLVTGGCGFIGSVLIRRLREEHPDAGVRVLDNLSVGTAEDLAAVGEVTRIGERGASGPPRAIELLVGDITDPQVCRNAIAGCEHVVHLAANTGVPCSVENPRLDLESNVVGTFNMLTAAREETLRSFVFASSGAPAGEVEPPIHEEIAPHPVSPYGASKLAGEGYCSAFSRTFGVPAVALRFGNVYGPWSGHKSSVVAKFIQQALAGTPCEIYGDGGQTRDFIYIDDLIGAIVLAASQAPAGEVFQIASGREHTVNELAGLLKSELARHGVDMELVHGSARLGDVRRNYSDTSKAAAVLGWRPEVSLPEGIRRTTEYFLRERETGRPG